MNNYLIFRTDRIGDFFISSILIKSIKENDPKANIIIIASDKNGVLPWEEGCESYWPQMCPPPLAAMAQMAILGEDTLLSKLEVNYKINN